ncbi:ATP-binding protein [Kitasatospora sp. NPDC088134]|uniref:ATP-binding protein n=1 Tax=Kitasatospora sp. NPDC088134 TaxID=3364071 RepID=UPI003806C725
MSVATRQAITPAPFGFRVLPSAEAVPDARRRVIQAVRGWGLPLAEDALRDVELLSGELITNAVSHTAAPCVVRVSWDGGRLRVEVTDVGRELPTAGGIDLDATDGRGLFLVAALATGWGAEPDPAGKRIWFEVGTTAAVSGDERLTALVRAAAPTAREVVPTSA